LQRIIKLETFEHEHHLKEDHLISERREIKRSVDKELHDLVDVKKKMELTIDDFIAETTSIRQNHTDAMNLIQNKLDDLQEPM